MTITAPVLRPDRLAHLPAVGALVGAWLALTPSLLPRTPLLQGVLCAVAALLGYGILALLSWMLRTAGLRVTAARQRLFGRLLVFVAVIGTAVMFWLGHRWQQDQRDDLGMPAAAATDPLVALFVALVGFAVLLIISRAIRALAARIGRLIAKFLPARVAAVMGLVLVVWVSAAIVNDFAIGRAAERLDRSFLAINDEFAADTAPPELAQVSAGPGSSVAWDDLGRQGRIFIANTPTQDDITAFFDAIGESRETAASASQPIRVYVGAGRDDLSLTEQAALAVDELRRTGAFEREVLNVATGTGRGWVNENQARALEYLWRGSTATVSIQYSYLPSWMSYLVDADRARDAGRILFDAVYDVWKALPEGSRPKLVVSGESLGSFGGEGAFTGASDLAARTDGALWVGPTANNLLWQDFTEQRDPGTPPFMPITDDGRTVRFSSDGGLWAGPGSWPAPRVGYLQHANDPVTWLDFGDAFRRPGFLSGERGPHVPKQMIWIPVITTLQLAVDQVAADIPDGQGHEFGQAPVAAWATILPPDRWSAADTPRLADWLAELRLTDLDTVSSS